MQKKDVQPKEVRRISKDTWIRASYKIAVEDTHFSKTLSPDFWPEGIKCREWLQSLHLKPPNGPTPPAPPLPPASSNSASDPQHGNA